METAKAVRIGRALAEADFVIIGTSNGFNMAEGLNLFCADAHFRETYGDLAQTDGIGSDMSSAAGFSHYNRAGMACAGMGGLAAGLWLQEPFRRFLPPLPQLRAAMGLLRAIHRFHAARAGLTALSRPAVPHRP